MLARTGKGDPAGPESSTSLRKWNRTDAGDVLSGQRALAHAGQRPGENHLSPCFAAAGTQLHHIVGHLDGGEIVLDDEDAVTGVAQALQELEQSIHVARMQPDGRLVQHIERVDELRAERIGEPDSLRLTTGERTGGAIHRQIAESDVAEKSHSIAGFLEDHRGNALLELSQLQLFEPRRELIDRQRGNLRDVQTADANVERIGLELGAVTARTFLRRLILAQEDSDVLPIALLLEVFEEREDSLVAARPCAQQQLPLSRSELVPRAIYRNSFTLRELCQEAPLVVVTRFCPGVDRPVTQRAIGVGNHQRLVVLEDGAESVALRARTARVVEREQLRRRRRRNRAIVRALESFGESQFGN